MGTLGRAERPSEDMFAGVDGIWARSDKRQSKAVSDRALRLVTEEVVEPPRTFEIGEDGQIIYPVLQTAVELNLTAEQHGEYIVAANDAIHPATD